MKTVSWISLEKMSWTWRTPNWESAEDKDPGCRKEYRKSILEQALTTYDDKRWDKRKEVRPIIYRPKELQKEVRKKNKVGSKHDWDMKGGHLVPILSERKLWIHKHLTFVILFFFLYCFSAVFSILVFIWVFEVMVSYKFDMICGALRLSAHEYNL